MANIVNVDSDQTSAIVVPAGGISPASIYTVVVVEYTLTGYLK